jgi:tryptophan halogenase
MEVPDSLSERLELFRSSGRFFRRGASELFSEESWVQILIGQGLDMKPDPVTTFVPADELMGFLDEIAAVVEDNAERMPDHAEFIRRLPAASPPQPAPTESYGLRNVRGATTR